MVKCLSGECFLSAVSILHCTIFEWFSLLNISVCSGENAVRSWIHFITGYCKLFLLVLLRTSLTVTLRAAAGLIFHVPVAEPKQSSYCRPHGNICISSRVQWSQCNVQTQDEVSSFLLENKQEKYKRKGGGAGLAFGNCELLDFPSCSMFFTAVLQNQICSCSKNAFVFALRNN